MQSGQIPSLALGMFAYLGASQLIRTLLTPLILAGMSTILPGNTISMLFQLFIIPIVSVAAAWTLVKDNNYRIGIFLGLAFNVVVAYLQFGANIG